MSIIDYCDSLNSAARYAIAAAGATEACPAHRDVMIRVGDRIAERHAYAFAKAVLRCDGTMWMREDLIRAIKFELYMAADGDCPACAALRDA